MRITCFQEGVHPQLHAKALFLLFYCCIAVQAGLQVHFCALYHPFYGGLKFLAKRLAAAAVFQLHCIFSAKSLLFRTTPPIHSSVRFRVY